MLRTLAAVTCLIVTHSALAAPEKVVFKCDTRVALDEKDPKSATETYSATIFENSGSYSIAVLHEGKPYYSQVAKLRKEAIRPGLTGDLNREFSPALNPSEEIVHVAMALAIAGRGVPGMGDVGMDLSAVTKVQAFHTNANTKGPNSAIVIGYDKAGKYLGSFHAFNYTVSTQCR